MVTVPFPLFTRVTFGPEPLPPPGIFAKQEKTAPKRIDEIASLDVNNLTRNRMVQIRNMFLPN